MVKHFVAQPRLHKWSSAKPSCLLALLRAKCQLFILLHVLEIHGRAGLPLHSRRRAAIWSIRNVYTHSATPWLRPVVAETSNRRLSHGYSLIYSCYARFCYIHRVRPASLVRLVDRVLGALMISHSIERTARTPFARLYPRCA